MFCNGEPVNKYLKIVELPNGTADGVIASFDQALFKVGVNNWRNGLVSMGSDGASVYTQVFAMALLQSLSSMCHGF